MWFTALVCRRMGDWSLERPDQGLQIVVFEWDRLLPPLMALSVPAQVRPGLLGVGGPGPCLRDQSLVPPWGSCNDPVPSQFLQRQEKRGMKLILHCHKDRTEMISSSFLYKLLLLVVVDRFFSMSNY